MLHLGHHRSAKGSCLFTPGAGAPRLDDCPAGLLLPGAGGHHSARRADVSRQRLGLASRFDYAGRCASAAGTESRSGQPARPARSGKGHSSRRRSHGLARGCRPARTVPGPLAPEPEIAGGGRRSGATRVADRGLRPSGYSGAPCLGHDRTDARGFGERPESLHEGLAGGGPAGAACQARHTAAVRRSPRIRRRPRSALGWPDDVRTAGAGALGRRQLSQSTAELRELDRRRMVPNWRRSDHRSRRLYQDRGSQQGPHQIRRRVDQFGRARKRSARSPSRSRGCRGRDRASPVG